MATCKTCINWLGGSRSRGECAKRAHLGFGSATSSGYGRRCDDHEARPLRKRLRHITKIELHAQLTEAKRDLAQTRGELSRIDRSADGLLRMAARLPLRDIQQLRGDLATLAVRKIAAAK